MLSSISTILSSLVMLFTMVVTIIGVYQPLQQRTGLHFAQVKYSDVEIKPIVFVVIQPLL